MESPEIINGPEKHLSMIELEHLLIGDYPQHSALYVLNHLDMVTDGSWDKNKFFEKTNIDFIKNASQYVSRYCETRNLHPPGKLSGNVAKTAEIIDNLVVELKESLIR